MHVKKTTSGKNGGRTYSSIAQADLPTGRKGKHNNIVVEMIEQLENLRAGQALKISLSDLPDKKANIRSAVNRASLKRGLKISTSSDDHFFYVWVSP